MKTKSTPGPWHTAATNMDQIQIVTVDPKTDEPNGIVAIVNRVAWCNDGEDRANARLIASAPDLLAALERCRYLLAVESDTRGKVRRHHVKAEMQLSPELEECREVIRAALAKATQSPVIA